MNPYQFLPPLSADEYDELKADIAVRGVMVPVEYDEAGNILDGHHRVRACEELGIAQWPRVVRQGLTEQEKRTHARTLNMARRQLSQEQRRELIRQELMEAPERSNRQIAAALGVDDKTVAVQRKELESIAEIPQCDRQTKDGRTYPAERQAPRAAAMVCAASPSQPLTITAMPAPPYAAVERHVEPQAPAEDEPAPSPEPAVRSEPPPVYEAVPAEPRRGLAVHFSSESPEHYTPKEIIAAVIACMGEIDLDPCSNSREAPNVPAREHYTAADDGLSREWKGRVYLNPPYGREIMQWVQKLCTEHEAGRVPEAVALVPARPDTAWFRRLRDYPVCFIAGRLTFLGNDDPAPFPSAVVYLGEDVGAFYRAFSGMGDLWQRLEPDNAGMCWPARFAE